MATETVLVHTVKETINQIHFSDQFSPSKQAVSLMWLSVYQVCTLK